MDTELYFVSKTKLICTQKNNAIILLLTGCQWQNHQSCSRLSSRCSQPLAFQHLVQTGLVGKMQPRRSSTQWLLQPTLTVKGTKRGKGVLIRPQSHFRLVMSPQFTPLCIWSCGVRNIGAAAPVIEESNRSLKAGGEQNLGTTVSLTALCLTNCLTYCPLSPILPTPL